MNSIKVLKEKVFFKEYRLLRDICIYKLSEEENKKIYDYISANYKLVYIEEGNYVIKLNQNVVLGYYPGAGNKIDIFTIQPEDIKMDNDLVRVLGFILEISLLINKVIIVCMEGDNEELVRIDSSNVIVFD